MMKRLFLTTSAAGLVLGGAAWAQSQNVVDVDALVTEYQTRGATYVEVYQGPTQIKVEATQGNQTLEVVYDAATGAILYTELDPADAEDMRRSGVEFNREDRDFTLDDDEDDDDDSYDDDDDGYDDDDDDDDDDSDDRGGDDDDGDDDSGSDDDGDDD
ncbi:MULTISPECIES: PepSY domain-containing protein [Roseicyclus]|uniref:PepSY domain-containing protein n=1 Tax=Roseicyclus marinus TaxID=2161673 RepID=A0AA48H3L2_9RHOB|nr:hypothetical protein MACH21_03920 [Roseicyclus marinus]